MILFDHSNEHWRAKYKRVNGAETYSKDLVKWQIPHWEKVLGPNDVISTCPMLHTVQLKGEYDTVIQYLHSFPFVNAFRRVRQVRALVNCRRMVFISAYEAYAKRLNEKGFETKFVPMGIDVGHVQQFKQAAPTLDRAMLWFGNINGKRHMLSELRRLCNNLGIRLDVWANGRFNGEPISQEEGWARASQYRFGAAVGRCALELYALGLKVLIIGRQVGGIVKSFQDIEAQVGTNFNGRIKTFSSHTYTCFRELENSLSVEPFDITTMRHAEVLCR